MSRKPLLKYYFKINELLEKAVGNKRQILLKKLKFITTHFPEVFDIEIIIFMYDMDNKDNYYKALCYIEKVDAVYWRIKEISNVLTYTDTQKEKEDIICLYYKLPFSNLNIVRWSHIQYLINKKIFGISTI